MENNFQYKDEQTCIKKNKRICYVQFGFGQRAASKDIEDRRRSSRTLAKKKKKKTSGARNLPKVYGFGRSNSINKFFV